MKSEKKDPPMRKDGLCARDGCENELSPIALKNFDPFCSAICCRLWHQVDESPPDTGR